MPLTRLVPAMIQQATARLLGRSTAGAGAVEEIQIGSGLTLAAGVLSASAGSGLGVGQTWQNLTGSRALATTYTNSTGKPIMVAVYCSGSPNDGNFSATVGGVQLGRQGFGAIASGVSFATITFIVPDGATYRADNTGGASLNSWSELR